MLKRAVSDSKHFGKWWHSTAPNVILHETILHEFLQYLKKQPTEKVALLLQTRVLPLYSMVAPTPYVLANANWLLGELANFLPDVRCSPLMAMSLHWLSLIGEFQEGF